MMVKKILLNGLVYSMGSVLNSLLAIFLIPMLTRLLHPEQYAQISIFLTATLLFSPLVSLAGDSSIARFYFDKTKKINKIITSILVIASAMFILLLVIVYFWPSKYFQSVVISKTLSNLALIYALVSVPSSVLLTILLAQGKALSYVLLSLMTFVINISLIYIFNLFSIENEYLRIGPMVISSILVGVFSLGLLFKRGLLSRDFLNFESYAEIIKYSSPLVIHTISGSLLGLGPIIVMAYAKEIENIAYYNIALTLGSSISLLSVGFNKSLSPFVLESFEASTPFIKNYMKIAVKISIGLICMIPLYLLIEPFILQVLRNFTESRYQMASNHLKWVVISFILNAIYLLYFNILICLKKTSSIAIYTLVSSILGIIGSYIALINFGVKYVGVGILTSFCMLTVCVCIDANLSSLDTGIEER